jgi:hypothetical protein
MADYQPLPFLKGTFAWSFLGYSYAERPPLNLLEPDALSSDNPWIVIAAVLERAKRGDHNSIPRLQAFFQASTRKGPEHASIHLTGDAGREADLAALQVVLEKGPDPLRAYAAEAAQMAGRLWLIPSMLTAWKRVISRANHETIGFAISSLLESPGGPIATSAGIYNADPTVASKLGNPAMRAMAERHAGEQSVTEFEQQVQARLEALRREFGDRAILWRGQLFNVRVLAEQMYALVRDPAARPLHGLFIPMRHKFEAATGINCSGCYRNGALQPLNAEALLETYLGSEASTKYEDNVRYFFGHRIPD